MSEEIFKIIPDFEGMQPEFVQVDKELLISAYSTTKLAIEYVKLAQLELVKSEEPDTLKYRTWEKQMMADLENLKNRLKQLEKFR